MSEVSNHAACPVCGHAADKSTEDLYHCCWCGHIFQWPPEVTAKYDYDYVHSRYDQYETAGAMSHLRLGLVTTIAGSKGLPLLDVGYGNGDFIKLAVKAGFDAFGNDVHGQGERYGVREANLDAVRLWDVVTFFDSLEHFPNLAPIKELNSHCRSVVVSTPDRPESFPGDLSWKHYRPGEHLHYFSLESLNQLFHPKKLIHMSKIEDVVRGNGKETVIHGPDGCSILNIEPNIVTVVYRNRDM